MATPDKNIEKWLKNLNINADGIKDLNDSFSGELVFGTAGLRGVMGIGTNRMNESVVARASKGLAQHILQEGRKSVALSYDSRINSREFARTAAEVFAACGLKVYITKELAITPLLAYAVKYYGCGGGVMITASHNPKDYNGYKVYNHRGIQISGDYANAVYEKISALDYFDIARADFEKELKCGSIEYISDDVYEKYINEVKNHNLSSCEGVKVCYTPLNGEGGKFAVPLLKNSGAQVFEIDEQKNPDGNFTSCPYPNPESPEALRLALKYAKEKGCDVVIANDPDADRIGAAYLCGKEFTMLNGDEIGLVICSYLLDGLSRRKDIKDSVIVRTVVTMRLIDKIAADYGVTVRKTLTGFKNICAEALKLDEKGEGGRFIAGYEESNGIAVGNYIYDKDGICAAMLLCEIAAALKKRGLNYGNYLNEIYRKYGIMKSRQIRINTFSEGFDRTEKIMDAFRKTQGNKFVNIVRVKDFLYDGDMPQNLIVYELENDNVICVRPSGTEPYIKIYMHASGENYEQNFVLMQDFVKSVSGT